MSFNFLKQQELLDLHNGDWVTNLKITKIPNKKEKNVTLLTTVLEEQRFGFCFPICELSYILMKRNIFVDIRNSCPNLRRRVVKNKKINALYSVFPEYSPSCQCNLLYHQN